MAGAIFLGIQVLLFICARHSKGVFFPSHTKNSIFNCSPLKKSTIFHITKIKFQTRHQERTTSTHIFLTLNPVRVCKMCSCAHARKLDHMVTGLFCYDSHMHFTQNLSHRPTTTTTTAHAHYLTPQFCDKSESCSFAAMF